MIRTVNCCIVRPHHGLYAIEIVSPGGCLAYVLHAFCGLRYVVHFHSSEKHNLRECRVGAHLLCVALHFVLSVRYIRTACIWCSPVCFSFGSLQHDALIRFLFRAIDVVLVPQLGSRRLCIFHLQRTNIFIIFLSPMTTMVLLYIFLFRAMQFLFCCSAYTRSGSFLFPNGCVCVGVHIAHDGCMHLAGHNFFPFFFSPFLNTHS